MSPAQTSLSTHANTKSIINSEMKTTSTQLAFSFYDTLVILMEFPQRAALANQNEDDAHEMYP